MDSILTGDTVTSTSDKILRAKQLRLLPFSMQPFGNLKEICFSFMRPQKKPE